jgi:hypothetical protein
MSPPFRPVFFIGRVWLGGEGLGAPRPKVARACPCRNPGAIRMTAVWYDPRDSGRPGFCISDALRILQERGAALPLPASDRRKNEGTFLLARLPPPPPLFP